MDSQIWGKQVRTYIGTARLWWLWEEDMRVRI